MTNKTVAETFQPPYYRYAAPPSRQALRALGFTDDQMLNSFDCLRAIEEFHSWIRKDAYLFNAVKYMWRAGKKGYAAEDVGKALYYLQQADYTGKGTEFYNYSPARLALINDFEREVIVLSTRLAPA